MLKVNKRAGVREMLTKSVVMMEIAEPSPSVRNITSGRMPNPINVPVYVIISNAFVVLLILRRVVC